MRTDMQRDGVVAAAQSFLAELGAADLRAGGLLPSSGGFAPTIYYPPLGALVGLDERAAFAGHVVAGDEALAVYVHIPFCQRHCQFCQCTVSTSRSPVEREAYLAALEREIDLCRQRFGYDRIPARSALLGGGTPTDMSPAQLDRLAGIVEKRFDLAPGAQWSCDVDVSTLTGIEGRERLAVLHGAGVRRLTIGAQSFDNGILESMGRTHTSAEIAEAVANARAAGFDDLCVDLIYGYPGQSLESWVATVDAAIALGVDEVQLYRLKLVSYGRGTSRLAAQSQAGVPVAASDAECLMMRVHGSLKLVDAGYRETLTRVFSTSPDKVSRYALDMYCHLSSTIGFGVTASSSYRDRFIQNARTLRDYYGHIEHGALPVTAGVVRSHDEQLRWALILPLKDWEVTRERYRELTGQELGSVFRSRVEPLKEAGLIEEDGRGLRLSARGRFFSDHVCQQFYARELLPLPEGCYEPGPLSPYR